MAPVKTTFARATAVKQQSSHEYLAEFPDDWCIGTGEALHKVTWTLEINCSQCRMEDLSPRAFTK